MIPLGDSAPSPISAEMVVRVSAGGLNEGEELNHLRPDLVPASGPRTGPISDIHTDGRGRSFDKEAKLLQEEPAMDLELEAEDLMICL